MCYIFLLILILIVWSWANNNGSWFSDLLYCCFDRLIIMLMMINRQIDYCYHGWILFDWLEIIIKSDQIWSKVCICVLAILFVEFNRDKWVPGTRFFLLKQMVCLSVNKKKFIYFIYRLKLVFFQRKKKLQFIKFHPFSVSKFIIIILKQLSLISFTRLLVFNYHDQWFFCLDYTHTHQ